MAALVLCLGGAALANGVADPFPQAAASTVPLSVGIVRCTFVDTSRGVMRYDTDPPKLLSPQRVLVTEIRYPTVFPTRGMVESPGARPAYRRGPFPLVVFAHGYDVTPDTYAPLLDAWVRAGFLVAAPFLPDENALAVAAQHGANTEADLVNEPADLSFLARALRAASRGAGGACPIVAHTIAAGGAGVAGHSDGGEAVGALVYNLGRDPQGVSFASLRQAAGFSAAIVMSGNESAGPYGASAPHPDLLVVQSAADRCNPIGAAVALYRDVGQPDKWFLELLGSHHLPPFDGVDAPAFAVVARVTTSFLEFSLEGGLTPARLAATGEVPGEARMFSGGNGPTVTAPPGPQLCGTT